MPKLKSNNVNIFRDAGEATDEPTFNDHSRQNFSEKTLWGGEGALKSTIPDLLKYAQFQLDDRNQMAKEAHKSIRELDTNYWIGYFWWIIGVKGKNLHFRHDGGAAGTRNVLLIYPESGIGISVMTNVVGPQIFNNLSKLGKGIYNDLKKQ